MVESAETGSGIPSFSMAVAFLAAEVAPFAKVGGLGDVAGSLPAALRRNGVDVVVLMPRYASIDLEAAGAEPVTDSLLVRAAGRVERFNLFRAVASGGVPVLFLDHADLFGDPRVYIDARDRERFTFFGKAVTGMLRVAEIVPDVLHANDWHMAPALLEDGDYARVMTIHNMAHQGITDLDYARFLDLPVGSLLAVERDGRYPGKVNLLARAIAGADIVTTVSPNYAREIMTPEFGEGLDSLLRSRAGEVIGILNGIDTAAFDPRHDRNIPQHFDVEHREGKVADKRALRLELGLDDTLSAPLVGIVSRLDDQKGFDLIFTAAERILAMGVQLAVLGTGAPAYEAALDDLAREHRGRLAARLQFDLGLAQRMYAGSDMFLMPSRFEPCGLGQMIAMRYGSVPIVRETGGLADSVHEAGDTQNGFTFREYDAQSLVDAVARAVDAFGDERRWGEIVARGMRGDFSWDRAALQYVATYRRALEANRAREVNIAGSGPALRMGE